MLYFADKIIDLGAAIGLDHARTLAQDIKRERDYKHTVSYIISRHEEVFEKASIEEEIDLDGLIDFLKKPKVADLVMIAVSGTQAERKRAKGFLYDMAFSFADANTREAKESIRGVISSIVESLRAIERGKVPKEFKTLLEDAVEEVIDNTNEKARIILEETRKVGEEIKRTVREEQDKRRYNSLYDAMLDNGGVELDNGAVIFNLNKADRDFLNNADADEIELMKAQLGSRLKGDENREDIVTLFWAETRITIQSKRRYQVMPMFKNYVRDTCMATIYADGIPKVVDRVHLARFYWDDWDVVLLKGDLYWLRILLFQKESVAISMGYNFGHLENVNERLFCFDKIKPIVLAKELHISGTGESEYNVHLELRGIGEEWTDHVERTIFWIEQMKKIQEIENYYGVRFKLPVKAEEEDYISIEILHDSLHRQNCRTLPGIPADDVDFAHDKDGAIVFEEEYQLVRPENLPNVKLFGHVFRPEMEYVIPCVLKWNDKEKCFESEDYGGIPTGIEFSVVR